MKEEINRCRKYKRRWFQITSGIQRSSKNRQLIKFLSESGNRALLQKVEAQYMQDNNRDMPIVDKDLYFVIEEKNNQVDLTDKGVEYMSQGNSDPNFFVLPDIGTEIAEVEAKTFLKRRRV